MLTTAAAIHENTLPAQGTYHQDGGVPPTPPLLPPDLAGIHTLLSNASRARLVHVLMRLQEPIATSELAREAGIIYRVAIARLKELELAGAVVAHVDVAPDGSRQGREIRWEADREWVSRATSALSTYLRGGD